MPVEALFQELRRQGEEKKQAVWRQARRQVAAYQEEAEARLRREQARCRQEQERLCGEEVEAVLAEARRRALLIRSRAEVRLAARLAELARRLVFQLRGKDYPDQFAALARELPAGDWQRVRVNPADQPLARDFFPEAECVLDSTISGGMAVEDVSRGLRVDNTLEKRLTRAWDDLLPRLLHQAGLEEDDDRAAG